MAKNINLLYKIHIRMVLMILIMAGVIYCLMHALRALTHLTHSSQIGALQPEPNVILSPPFVAINKNMSSTFFFWYLASDVSGFIFVPLFLWKFSLNSSYDCVSLRCTMICCLDIATEVGSKVVTFHIQVHKKHRCSKSLSPLTIGNPFTPGPSFRFLKSLVNLQNVWL